MLFCRFHSFCILVIDELIQSLCLILVLILTLKDVHLNYALTSFLLSDRIKSALCNIVNASRLYRHCIVKYIVDKFQNSIVTSEIILEEYGRFNLALLCIFCIHLLSCKEYFRVRQTEAVNALLHVTNHKCFVFDKMGYDVFLCAVYVLIFINKHIVVVCANLHPAVNELHCAMLKITESHNIVISLHCFKHFLETKCNLQQLFCIQLVLFKYLIYVALICIQSGNLLHQILCRAIAFLCSSHNGRIICPECG